MMTSRRPRHGRSNSTSRGEQTLQNHRAAFRSSAGEQQPNECLDLDDLDVENPGEDVALRCPCGWCECQVCFVTFPIDLNS